MQKSWVFPTQALKILGRCDRSSRWNQLCRAHSTGSLSSSVIFCNLSLICPSSWVEHGIPSPCKTPYLLLCLDRTPRSYLLELLITLQQSPVIFLILSLDCKVPGPLGRQEPSHFPTELRPSKEPDPVGTCQPFIQRLSDCCSSPIQTDHTNL